MSQKSHSPYLKWLLPLALGLLGAATAIVLSRRDWAGASRPTGERRANPDPQSLVAETTERVGVDVERLRDMQVPEYQPLIEYLTYIQVQRGARESLVFIRRKDLDAMADIAGTEDKDQLIEQFKQLGVAVSMN